MRYVEQTKDLSEMPQIQHTHIKKVISVPLFMGSLLSEVIKRNLNANKNLTTSKKEEQHQSGFLIASGKSFRYCYMEITIFNQFTC